jgi:hypothetical protein
MIHLGPHPLPGHTWTGGRGQRHAGGILTSGSRSDAATRAAQIEHLGPDPTTGVPRDPIPVAFDGRPAASGWYQVVDASTTAHIGKGTRWEWSAVLRQVAGPHARMESVYYGGSRRVWEAVYPDLLGRHRPFAAVPTKARGVATPTAVDTVVVRDGPGGSVAVHYVDDDDLGLYEGGIVTATLRPEDWYSMGAQVRDALIGGRPITAPGTPLPAGFQLTNGLVTLGWTGSKLILRSADTSDTARWGDGWEVGIGTSIFAYNTLTRAVLLYAGPELASIRLELTGPLAPLLILEVSLRRGDRGVILDGRSPQEWNWALDVPHTVTFTTQIESTTVARRTATTVGGSTLLVAPMSSEHSASGTTVTQDDATQRTVWYLGAIHGGGSPAAGDAGPDLVRFAWGAGGELPRVAI